MPRTPETDKQRRRRLRVILQEARRETHLSRIPYLDHYRARDLARRPADTSGDSGPKHYTNVCLRYCGALVIWVGFDPQSNTYEGRIEGFPTVTDIALHVRNPSSSKTLTRAARYTLAFLEQATGCEVAGSIKLPDGTFAVTVSCEGRLLG